VYCMMMMMIMIIIIIIIIIIMTILYFSITVAVSCYPRSFHENEDNYF
jgi:hypothetical protein